MFAVERGAQSFGNTAVAKVGKESFCLQKVREALNLTCAQNPHVIKAPHVKNTINIIAASRPFARRHRESFISGGGVRHDRSISPIGVALL